MKTIKEDIQERIEKGLITEQLEPIKCKCGSTDYYELAITILDSLVVEKDRHCFECLTLLGHWSHGHWMP